MQEGSPFDLLLFNLKQATSFIKKNRAIFICFVLFLFIQDLINFYIQNNFNIIMQNAHWVEMFFQFLLLYTSVFFIHVVNCNILERKASVLKLFGESILLLPGYILQSIFWLLSSLLGLCLLVIPGIYIGVTFYMAPMLSVLYPDYSGTTFLLARELSQENLKATFMLVIVTSFIPFIPEGLLFFLTGNVKSIWSLIYSPIGAGVYLFFELVFLLFVLEKIQRHRDGNQAQGEVTEAQESQV